MLYTFDIFDTLIARRSFNHLGMFEAVASAIAEHPEKYGVQHDFAGKFYSLRKFADIEASKELGREATFEDIYNLLARRAGIGEVVKKALMDLEIETELSLFEPIEENIDTIEKHLHAGHKVVLLSDMYHTQETLRSFVSKASSLLGSCDIMVSAYDGGTKGTGKLFEKCIIKYGVSPEEIIHFGDHPHADFAQPISMGINVSSRFEKGDANYYTSYLSSLLEGNYPFHLYAGTSRICDLNNNFNEVEKIGCYIAGPLLYGFVEWLLLKALKQSIDCLYFLSRDGLILSEIAEKVIVKRNYPIRVKYLHVSRLAVYRCSVFEKFASEHLDFAFLNDGSVTLRDLAERLCIPLPTFLEICSGHGICIGPENPLNESFLARVRGIVETDGSMAHAASKASYDVRKLLLAYLEDEGFDFFNACFVDVGWKGSIQDALWRIGKHENLPTRFKGFYFGIDVETPYICKDNSKSGFIIDPGDDKQKLWFHNGVFKFLEIFCHHTKHGLTRSYALKKDRVFPVHDKVLNINEQTLAELRRGISSFVQLMLKYSSTMCNYRNFIGYYLRLLQEPSCEMAEAIGTYKHFEGVHDNRWKELAPKLTKEQVDWMARTGKPFKTSWQEGSMKRSDPALWQSYYGKQREIPSSFFDQADSVIIIFARYPRANLLNDGMYRRIKAVDDILAGHKRIYIYPERLPDQSFHVPKSEQISDEVFTQALDFRFIAHELHFAALVEKSSLVYAHTGVHSAQYLLPFLKTGKIVLDAHGVASEEWLLSGQPSCSKFWNGLERAMILGCRNVIVVSEAMSKFYHAKYGAPLDKFIHMPIFSEHENKKTAQQQDSVPTILYAGGTHPWQNIDLMLDTARNYTGQAKFLFLSNDVKTFNDKLLAHGIAHSCQVACVAPDEIDDWYALADYGFVLRDDDPVNNVAFPTKLMEYIQTGVVPILKTSHLGDVEKYGIQYVPLEDMLACGLPGREKWERMAAHNLSLVAKVREEYAMGRKELVNIISTTTGEKKPESGSVNSALYPDYLRNSVLPMYFTCAYAKDGINYYQSIDVAEFPFSITFAFSEPTKIGMFAIECNNRKLTLKPPIANFMTETGTEQKNCSNAETFPKSPEGDIIYSGNWIYFDCPLEKIVDVRVDLEITLFEMETLLSNTK